MNATFPGCSEPLEEMRQRDHDERRSVYVNDVVTARMTDPRCVLQAIMEGDERIATDLARILAAAADDEWRAADYGDEGMRVLMRTHMDDLLGAVREQVTKMVETELEGV